MNIDIKSGIFLRKHVHPKAKVDIWCAHGLGESSFSFKEAFNSVLKDDANIFAPDFPGSGVTPWQNCDNTVESFTHILVRLIKAYHTGKPVYILGHSASGIVGTYACEALGDLVAGFVNVEGNLTKPDGFLSGLAKDYSTAEDYYQFCLDRVRKAMKDNIAFNRYYASFIFCHPDCFFSWAKETFEATDETKSGADFLKLSNKKIFMWGDKSMPEETRDFITMHGIPHIGFRDAGHWPMVDQPDAFYQAVRNFILD